jgi:hypothetical protein
MGDNKVASPVELTSVRYKDEVIRGNYSTITAEDISYFQDLLGKDSVSRNPAELERHNVDYYGLVRGKSLV